MMSTLQLHMRMHPQARPGLCDLWSELHEYHEHGTRPGQHLPTPRKVMQPCEPCLFLCDFLIVIAQQPQLWLNKSPLYLFFGGGGEGRYGAGLVRLNFAHLLPTDLRVDQIIYF